MSGNMLLIIDIVLFAYIILGIANPSLWIQKPELKNDPKEHKKIRRIAIILLIVETIFCVFEYVI